MRRGKRALAGVSAAALGLALVPFVATPAFAATSITSVTLDGPLRAGSFTQTAAIVGVDLDVATQKFLVVPSGSNPAALTVNQSLVDDTITSATAGKIKIANATVAGTYSIRVCVVATAASNCNTPVVFTDINFTTTGAPATVAVTPASQQSVEGLAQTYTATIRDASNNVTQLNSSTENVVITGVSTAGTPTIGQSGLQAALAADGTGDFTASNSTAGTTTLTATPTGAFFGTPVTATLVTNPVVVDDTVTLTSPVSTVTNHIKVGTTALTFQLQRGADDTGTYFEYAVSGTAIAASSGILAVGANGTATLNLTVTDDSAINNNTVTVQAGTGTLTVTYKTPVAQITAAAPNVVTSAGSTVTLTGQVADQWGTGIAGYTVLGEATAGTGIGTFTSSGLTNASGNYSVTFANPTAGDDSQTTVVLDAFLITDLSTVSDDTVNIYYTASGTATVTSLLLGNAGVIDDSFASTVQVPFGGTAGTAVTGNAGSTGNVVPLVASTDVPGTVTYSVTGGKLSTTASTAWNGGSASVTAAADDTVYLFSTSVGTATVTATAGGNSLTASVPVTTTAAAAYNMEFTESEVNVEVGAIGTVTLEVTDVFGNPVQTADDSGSVDVSASGSVLLVGPNVVVTGANTLTIFGVTTDANGRAEITYVAAGSPGTGVIVAGPSIFQSGAAAWVSPFTPPAGAPAPVTSAAVEIVIGPIVATSIELRRATRDGVTVTARGATTGFSEGQEVRIRFRAYNEKAQAWTKWRTGAVTEVQANGRFAAQFDQRGLLRVKATIPSELSSNTLRVAR